MRGSIECLGRSLWQVCCFAGFRTATLRVRRVKQGTPSTHPIIGDELRALRRLRREQGPKSPFVFTSERGSPFTTAGFARMIERAGKAARAVKRAAEEGRGLTNYIERLIERDSGKSK